MKNYVSFDKYLKRRFKDPKFRKSWEDAEPEYQLAKAVMESRVKKVLTPQKLVLREGTFSYKK